jgi:hypothetical protein
MAYMESPSRFIFCLRMIFSENRYPLFRIMRRMPASHESSARTLRR